MWALWYNENYEGSSWFRKYDTKEEINVCLSHHRRRRKEYINCIAHVCDDYFGKSTISMPIVVGTLFVENSCPKIYNQIDHIDGDTTNNYYKNLRWCCQGQMKQT